MEGIVPISDSINRFFILRKVTGHEVSTLLVATALDELLTLVEFTIESVTDGEIMGDLKVDFEDFEKAMGAEYVEYAFSPFIEYNSEVEAIQEVFKIERVPPITTETFGL